MLLQQCLPFTVLKRNRRQRLLPLNYWVATVLTVYGIETVDKAKLEYIQKQVATVLTVYGIETLNISCHRIKIKSCNSAYRLRY